MKRMVKLKVEQAPRLGMETEIGNYTEKSAVTAENQVFLH